MKYWFIILTAILLTACASSVLSQPEQPPKTSDQTVPVTDEATATQTPVVLEDLGPAPELTNQVWLNVDQPLRLADLRGQVVLLEMWTFG